MRSTGRRNVDGSRRVRVAPVATGGILRPRALYPQDLVQRRLTDLELLGRGLAGAHYALDLVAGAAQEAGERRVGVALRPGEHLDGERHAPEADDRLGRGA